MNASANGLSASKPGQQKNHQISQIIVTKAQEMIVPQDQNPEDQIQMEVKAGKRLVKIILVTSVVVIPFLAVAIAFLVQYLLSGTKQISRSQLQFDDKSRLSIVRTQIRQNNVFSPDLYLLLDIMVSHQSNQKRRLQGQEETSNYYISSYSPQTGVTVRISPDGKTGILVNMPVIINHYLQTSQQGQQFMDSSPSDAQSSERVASEEEILQTMNAAFSEALENFTNGQIQFINMTMVNFKISPTGLLQFDDNVIPIRLLASQQTRKLFIGSIGKFLGTVATKVAGVVVDAVRQNTPLIGKIVDGVISGVAGQGFGNLFSGLMQGMTFGNIIGTAAQSMLNACIPQGTLKISCSLNSVSGVLMQFAGNAFQSITNTLIPDLGKTIGGFMSGNSPMNFSGDLMKMIPGGALQDFAFGAVSSFINTKPFFR